LLLGFAGCPQIRSTDGVTTFGAEPTPAFQSDDLDFIGGEEETRILSTGKAAWWACGFAKSLRHLQRSLMAFVTVC